MIDVLKSYRKIVAKQTMEKIIQLFRVEVLLKFSIVLCCCLTGLV